MLVAFCVYSLHIRKNLRHSYNVRRAQRGGARGANRGLLHLPRRAGMRLRRPAGACTRITASLPLPTRPCLSPAAQLTRHTRLDILDLLRAHHLQRSHQQAPALTASDPAGAARRQAPAFVKAGARSLPSRRAACATGATREERAHLERDLEQGLDGGLVVPRLGVRQHVLARHQLPKLLKVLG